MVCVSKPAETGCVCLGVGKWRSGGAEVNTHHQVWPQNQCEKTDQTPKYEASVKQVRLLLSDKPYVVRCESEKQVDSQTPAQGPEAKTMPPNYQCSKEKKK